jgi:hypothetical protein
MISVSERIALTKEITKNSKNTPVNIIERIEEHLHEIANGDSFVYNDITNIKQRIKDVFAMFEAKKKDSIRRGVITRFDTSKKAKIESTAETIQEAKAKNKAKNKKAKDRHNLAKAKKATIEAEKENTKDKKIYIELLDIKAIDNYEDHTQVATILTELTELCKKK